MVTGIKPASADAGNPTTNPSAATANLQPQVVVVQHAPSPGIAALLSFVIPGAGQMYQGRVLAGLLWFAATVVGYFFFILPGIGLHLLCIISAAISKPAPSTSVG